MGLVRQHRPVAAIGPGTQHVERANDLAAHTPAAGVLAL
jgi:hypothetical protein